ncbi:MAG: glycosyltransferase [Planctomycetota bacterium]|nr:glycosyltransferase [Planctomycetota bacterium]
MSKRPMLRVLTASWPGQREPWRARFIRDLHIELAQHFDTEVIAPRIHAEDLTVEQDGPIEVRRFSYRSGGRSPRQGGAGPIAAFSWWRSMRREVRRWKPLDTPAVILTHWAVPAAPVARHNASRLDCPYIVWCHGSDVHRHGRTRLGAYLLRKGLSVADRVLASSEPMARELRDRHHIKRVDVLPVGIDPAFIETAPVNSPEPPLKLLYVGERIESKGYLRVLHAVENARLQGAKLSLEVIGEGPLSTIDSHHEVVLRGALTSAEVLEAMDRSHLLLLPSLAEGTPLVVQESMARGLPVAATAVGGVPDLFGEGGGWYPIDGSDDAEVCASLSRLIQELSLDSSSLEQARLALQMQDTARFSRRVCGETLRKIITEVLR